MFVDDNAYNESTVIGAVDDDDDDDDDVEKEVDSTEAIGNSSGGKSLIRIRSTLRPSILLTTGGR